MGHTEPRDDSHNSEGRKELESDVRMAICGSGDRGLGVAGCVREGGMREAAREE